MTGWRLPLPKKNLRSQLEQHDSHKTASDIPGAIQPGRFIECCPLKVATYSLVAKLLIPVYIQQVHDKLDVAVWGKLN